MKRIKIILSLLVVFVVSFQSRALDFSRGQWYALTKKNVFMELKQYGVYDHSTGRMVNSFTPSAQNGNLYENISLIDDSSGLRVVWSCSADGSWTYRARIDGDYIYLTGKRPVSGGAWRPYNSWMKIVEWSGSRILTTSKEGTYRIWQVYQR